jgi:hypothetical protein
MRYFLLLYFNSKPLHVSRSFVARHQAVLLCIYSSWYSQHNARLYQRVDPPDDEQQDCSKHVKVYYWNKLRENNASCWFILYGYITMQDNKTLNMCNVFLVLMWFNRHSHSLIKCLMYPLRKRRRKLYHRTLYCYNTNKKAISSTSVPRTRMWFVICV